MKHSFHGRSLGALSVTGNTHYQEPFKPLIGGIRFAEFNNLESVKEQITDKTCAIIMETVQGEGGIYPADPEFLKGVRKLCDEKDILLILDEIQCGMGRTGTMFACQSYGVQPDVMTCAKALGCGVPVGAFVLGEKAAAASLVPGDHGTTYGGNPFVCAAVSKVFDIYEKDDMCFLIRHGLVFISEEERRQREQGTQYIDELLDALNDVITNSQQEIEELEEARDKLAEEINQKLNQMEEKRDKLVEEINQKRNQMLQGIEALRSRLAELGADCENILPKKDERIREME